MSVIRMIFKWVRLAKNLFLIWDSGTQENGSGILLILLGGKGVRGKGGRTFLSAGRAGKPALLCLELSKLILQLSTSLSPSARDYMRKVLRIKCAKVCAPTPLTNAKHPL